MSVQSTPLSKKPGLHSRVVKIFVMLNPLAVDDVVVSGREAVKMLVVGVVVLVSVVDIVVIAAVVVVMVFVGSELSFVTEVKYNAKITV